MRHDENVPVDLPNDLHRKFALPQWLKIQDRPGNNCHYLCSVHTIPVDLVAFPVSYAIPAFINSIQKTLVTL